MDPTTRVALGRTGLSVSRLALGTGPLGGLYRAVSEEDAHAVVRHALRSGLSYLDTAPFYGLGLAERRIGEALRGVDRGSYVLSTKVGRIITPGSAGGARDFPEAPPARVDFDFSGDGVRRSLETSLERLGLDRVDIVYIHDPDDHEEQALTETYPALERMRAEGTVTAIGVGMNQPRIPTRFVRETDIDAVLVAGRLTLLDVSAADELLPAAADRGVAVVVGGVYNSGILADPRPGASYDYTTAPDEVLERAVRMDGVCRGHGVPLTAPAIQFPFRWPEVTCVLTGSRDTRELDRNLAAFRTPVPDRLWAELAATGTGAP